MEENTEIITLFILLTILAGFFVYSMASSADEQIIVDRLTEQSTKIAIFKNLLAAPCLNDDYNNRVESRKFIMDAKRLDEESSTPELSCLDIGNSKYRIDIKDLDTNNRWTFSNYQPIAPQEMDADFEMIVQVNTNIRDISGILDEYHKAILTTNIEFDMTTDNLQDEMFCDEANPDKCASGNCIKGPGQAYATCHPGDCAYDKDSDADCTMRCECKTADCTDNKCSGSIPAKLLLGQPCKNNGECLSGICAINKRCAKKLEFAQLTGKVTVSKKGDPIEGATVEIKIPTGLASPSHYTMSDDSDRDGDYQIQNIEIKAGEDKMYVNIMVKKDGYHNTEKIRVRIKRGYTATSDIRMAPS